MSNTAEGFTPSKHENQYTHPDPVITYDHMGDAECQSNLSIPSPKNRMSALHLGIEIVSLVTMLVTLLLLSFRG